MKNYIKNLIYKYIKHKKDCGSTEIQIVLKSIQINNLIKHLKYNHKDIRNKTNLNNILSKRAKLVKYLKKKNIELYNNLIKDLKLIDVVK